MRKLLKITIIAFLFIYFQGFFTHVSAQLLQSERVEIEMEDFSEEYQVVSAKKEGVIIFRETDIDNRENDPMWEFIMYDTTLTEKWKRSYFINDDYELRGYDYEDNELLVLFKNGPYDYENLTIMDLDLESGDTIIHNLKRIVPIKLTHFERSGETVLLGGYANDRPVVLQYDLLTKKMRVLPGIYGNLANLLDVIPYDENKTFKVVLSRENRGIKNQSIVVLTFDQYGGMLQNAKFDPDPDKDFIDAHPIKFNGQKQTIAGTYGINGSKYSRGLFWAELDANGNSTVKYFNYGNFDRFFSYMRENREERVKRRIKRRKEKGRKLRFNYRMAVHDFIKSGDKYYLLGEAFYPKYRSNYYFGSLFYNYGPGSYNTRYLVGYQYTHSVLACFNENGTMLWDHAYSIDEVERERLRQVSYTVMNREDSIVFLHTNENKLKYKVVNDDEILKEKNAEDIMLSKENEEIRKVSDEELYLEAWYDSKFFVYGIQKIKQINKDGWNDFKEVFFINKVTFN